MTLLQTVGLSIVQGITELLPISSSGHLLLVSKYLFEVEITQSVLVGLHLGTTLAILVYFTRGITKLLKENWIELVLNLILASIPAALVGLYYGDAIEANWYSSNVIATSLIVWGIVFIIAEQWIYQRNSKLVKVKTSQSIFMGLCQTIALIPGTSRSGITTVAGIIAGLDKYTALEYSFIMGLPVLLGSAILSVSSATSPTDLLTTEMLVGIIVSFIVGLGSMHFLKSISKRNFLTVFGIYRIALGSVLLLV